MHACIAKRQIAKTFKTRDRKAAELQIGRWKTLTQYFSVAKLAQLFRGDDKRVRPNYDSYKMAQQGKAVDSHAWDIRRLRHYEAVDGKHKFYMLQNDPVMEKVVPESYVDDYRKFLADKKVPKRMSRINRGKWGKLPHISSRI